MPMTTPFRRRPLLAAPRALHAQGAWPSRPITMVAPYPPGGTTDLSIGPVPRAAFAR